MTYQATCDFLAVHWYPGKREVRDLLVRRRNETFINSLMVPINFVRRNKK